MIYPASVEDTVEVEEVEDDQSVDPIKLFNTLMGNSQEKSPLIGSGEDLHVSQHCLILDTNRGPVCDGE